MSLRILLVEEDPARAETLQNALRDRMLSNEIDYETSTNVHAAAELLRTHYYDLLILDILLPVRDGGHPIGDGGVRLLRALKTHTDLRLPGYIIGLTAHESLAALYGAQRDSTGSGSEVPTQLVCFSTPPVREHSSEVDGPRSSCIRGCLSWADRIWCISCAEPTPSPTIESHNRKVIGVEMDT
jgi:CheY-like chemotaxis protein